MFGVENELSTFHLDSGPSTLYARSFFFFFGVGGALGGGVGCGVVHKVKISHSLLAHML